MPLTPFNTFGLRCAALGPGQAEAAYHRCGSARPGGYVKKELVDRAGAGSLAFPRLQICEGVMPGKTRKRGGGGRATGGPGAASSRWRGSWPQLDDDTLPPQSQSNRSVRNFFTGLHPRHHAARLGSLRGGTHSERRGTHLVGGGCRHKLRALRGPGESYSDVILRLAKDGEPR